MKKMQFTHKTGDNKDKFIPKADFMKAPISDGL
jgi:hypothetical protein